MLLSDLSKGDRLKESPTEEEFGNLTYLVVLVKPELEDATLANGHKIGLVLSHLQYSKLVDGLIVSKFHLLCLAPVLMV